MSYDPRDYETLRLPRDRQTTIVVWDALYETFAREILGLTAFPKTHRLPYVKNEWSPEQRLLPPPPIQVITRYMPDFADTPQNHRFFRVMESHWFWPPPPPPETEFEKTLRRCYVKP